MNRTRITAALAAVGLAAIGSLALAGPASAHDQTFDVTCTSITVNLTNYPAGSTIGGTLDGVDLGTTTFGPSFSQSAALDPAVAHSWSIVVVSGDGDHSFDRTFAGVSDPACIPVVVPPVEPPVEEEPPVVVPPAIVLEPRVQDYVDCLGGRFVLDNTGSNQPVTFTVQQTAYQVAAGAALHTDADGTLYQPVDGLYTVTALDQTWEFASAGNCPVDEPEEPATTVVPPVTATPVTPATPVVPVTPAAPTTPATLTAITPATPAPAAAARALSDTDSLAFTGSSSTPVVIAAAAMLAAGIALVAWRRKRATQ